MAIRSSSLSGKVNALPEEIPTDEFPPIQPGTGRIDVTVTDRFGAPMKDVTVALSGLVARSLQTNSTGAAMFADLPDARYDVVASRKGLPNSLPRVLDVSGLAVPVDIVLKPSAPTMSMSISCGIAPPRTLEEFAAHSDAVVHLKIERQRTFRRSQLDSDAEKIVTVSKARWIESFKAGSTIASGADILQAGGRIDDGAQIQIYDARPHAQLNVGDEYVLFLRRQHDGSRSVGIYFEDSGAFRIRNGRVEPLAEHYLASKWKGRSTVKFFEALRTSLKASTTR